MREIKAYPVKHGTSVARVFNGKTVKTDPATNPLGLSVLLDVDSIKLPYGWYQTSLACPMQYSKIVSIGSKHYEGYIRSRHDSPFSMEIILLKRNWKSTDHPWKGTVWEHEPIDKPEDNPPIRSMGLIDKRFREIADGKG